MLIHKDITKIWNFKELEDLTKCFDKIIPCLEELEKVSTIILSKSIKFIAHINTMGDNKVVIYVPQNYHQEILQNFKGKALKITIEEAI